MENKNEYGNEYLDEKLHNGTPDGLSLTTRFSDDEAESKQFTGVVDSTLARPVECPVTVRIGYAVEGCLSKCKTMAEMKAKFTTDSAVRTVRNLQEFRQAIIDGAIIAEQKRLADVAEIIAENDIATGDTPGKRQRWGVAQKYLRQKRPNLHVFLNRNLPIRDYRVYIMKTKCGEWHWFGFSDVSKIDFPELYKNLLRTEQHCKNLDCLCSAIEINNK